MFNVTEVTFFFSFLAGSYCRSDICQNGGTCVEATGTFTCRCAEGYTGYVCDNGKCL